MSSDSTLVEQFLREECTPHVLELLRDAMGGEDRPARRQFEFNRFNLDLDFERQMATLNDELDVSPQGTVTFTLAELRALLRCEP